MVDWTLHFFFYGGDGLMIQTRLKSSRVKNLSCSLCLVAAVKPPWINVINFPLFRYLSWVCFLSELHLKKRNFLFYFLSTSHYCLIFISRASRARGDEKFVLISRVILKEWIHSWSFFLNSYASGSECWFLDYTHVFGFLETITNSLSS